MNLERKIKMKKKEINQFIDKIFKIIGKNFLIFTIYTLCTYSKYNNHKSYGLQENVNKKTKKIILGIKSFVWIICLSMFIDVIFNVYEKYF